MLGLLLSLGTANYAHAQQGLSGITINDKTVVGRLGSGSGSGSAQAIPFATLLTQLNSLTTVVSGPATTTSGDVMLWNNTSGTLAKDSGVAMTGTGTIAMGSANTLTLSASPTLAGPGTLNVASGKTLTDTSAAGAVLLLGATGGGFAAYAGASCGAGLPLNAISAAGAGTCLVAKAATNKTIATPSAPGSTSAFTMQGLAGTITPGVSGNVMITISGYIVSNADGTAGRGVIYQISHGTGGAPVAGATLTGTQDGQQQEYLLPVASTAADIFVPFSTSVVVTGLTVGTAYWIDLASEGVGTTNFSVKNVNIAAAEI